MATRIYTPSSGASAPVTPSTWNHATLAATTYTQEGKRNKAGNSSLTTRTTATGTVSPTTQAVFRYVFGPLAPNQISGTINQVMRCYESAIGANATTSIAVKLIQSGGADRSVLLAATAADSAASPQEYTTTLGTRRAWTAAEARPITLTSQTPTNGDYLVVEIGIRSATTVSRSIQQVHGDPTSTSDCPDSDGDTNAYVPWFEFSNDIPWQTLWPTTTISDAVTVSEAVTVRIETNIQVSDAIALSEAVTVDCAVLPVDISVSDSVTLSESRTLVVGTVVVPTQSETITITESVALSGLVMPDLLIGKKTVNGVQVSTNDQIQIYYNTGTGWDWTGPGASVIWFGEMTSPYYNVASVRFQLDSAIPVGADILSAKVSVYGQDANIPDSWLYVVEDDDAPQSGYGDVSFRPTWAGSGNTVTYPTTEQGTGVVHFESWVSNSWIHIEIKNLVQHLVDTYSGLAQSAYVNVWFDGTGTVGNENGFHSYELPPIPYLTIEYNAVHEHITVGESVNVLIYKPTRFYLQSTGTPAVVVPPTWQWDIEEGTQHKLSLVKGDSPLTDYAVSETSAVSRYVAAVKFISPPLKACTIPINTIWKLVARIKETAGALISEQVTFIDAYSTDGQTKKNGCYSGSWSYVEANTSLRSLCNVGRDTIWGALDIEEGDRLVLDMGFRFTNTTTDQHTGTINLGDAPTTALSYDNTDTDEDYPYFEFDFQIEQSAFEVGVSDTVTVGESVSVQVEIGGELYVSISEGVGVSDAALGIVSDISLSVSNSVTVTDTVVVRPEIEIRTTQAIGVLDISALSYGLACSISEVVVITESRTLGILLEIQRSEGISVSELVSVSFDISRSVADSVIVGELVLIALELNALVSNAISVSESRTLELPLVVLVNQGVGVSESVAGRLSDVLLFVTQSITVSEQPSVIVEIVGELYILASNSVAVADVPILVISDVSLSWSDAVAVVDSRIVEVAVSVSRTESVVVSESVSVVLDPLAITRADAVLVSESRSVAISLEILRTESVAVSESISGKCSDIFLLVLQAIVVGEQPAVIVEIVGELYAPVSNSVVVTEAVLLCVSDIFLSVADVIGVSDARILGNDLNINISEIVNVGDYSSAGALLLEISRADAIAVAEVRGVAYGLEVFRVEPVTTSDQPSLTVSGIFLSLADAVVLSESVQALVTVPGELYVSITEGVVISEAVGFLVSGLFLITIQAVVVSELPTAALNDLTISRSNSISIADSVTEVVGTVVVLVSNSVVVAEAVTGQFSDVFLSVSDALAVTDVPTLFVASPENLYRQVSDVVGVADSRSLVVGTLNLIVTDGIYISDVVTAYVTDYFLLILESVAVSESNSRFLELNRQVSDSVVLSEVHVQVVESLPVSVSDAIVVQDARIVAGPDLNVLVTNSIAVLDIQIVELSGPDRYISVADAVSVSEWLVVEPLLLEVRILEAVAVGQFIQILVQRLIYGTITVISTIYGTMGLTSTIYGKITIISTIDDSMTLI